MRGNMGRGIITLLMGVAFGATACWVRASSWMRLRSAGLVGPMNVLSGRQATSIEGHHLPDPLAELDALAVTNRPGQSERLPPVTCRVLRNVGI